MRADDLAQIDRHRLAARDGQDRLLLDLALQRVDGRIVGDHALGEIGVALDQAPAMASAICRSGKAAHLGDLAGEILQIDVEGLGGVVHSGRSIRSSCVSRSGR